VKAVYSLNGVRELVRWSGVVWQAIHLASASIVVLVLYMVQARAWGPEAFGWYNYLFSLAAVGGVLADFGLDFLTAKHAASEGPGIPRKLLRFKALLLLTVAGLFSLVAVSFETKFRPPFAALGGGVLLLSCTTFMNGILRGLERLDVEAKIGLIQKVAFVGLSLWGVVSCSGTLLWVGGCYLASQAIGLGLTLASLCNGLRTCPSMGEGSSSWRSPDSKACSILEWGQAPAVPSLPAIAERNPTVRNVFKEAWPLFAVTFLSFLALRFDLFLIQWLKGPDAVGLYAAGFRFVEGLSYGAAAYLAALFPRLVKAKDDPGRWLSLTSRSTVLLAAAGLLGAVVLWVAAPLTMTPLLGGAFEASGPVLQGLSLGIPVLFVGLLLGHVLISQSRQKAYAWALLLGIAATVVTDLWAVPLWGAIGAVLGFWARLLVVLAVLAASVRRHARASKEHKASGP